MSTIPGARGAHDISEPPMPNLTAKLIFAWTFVGVPLAYGVFETMKKAAALFTG